MAINNNFTKLATTIRHFKNPNAQSGTLLIEIPADAGRAYSGYKRGGIIEGAERLRKELISAVIWLFGIPVFNKLGNMACEKILKLPMDIDYSNGNVGRDAIRQSIEYLSKEINENNLDVSELSKYGDKFKGCDVDKMAKKVKTSKQVISIAAWALNCILMGFVLPKINQKITANKIKKEKQKNASLFEFTSFEQFKKNTKKSNEISFKGLDFASAADKFTYGINNNNTYRLISTDGPMIIGRTITSRNKFEGFENAFMDASAIYFYNFSLGHVEKILRKIFHTPNVGSTTAEQIAQLDASDLKFALEGLKVNKNASLEDLFGKDVQKLIYNEATYNKYSKINRFTKDSDLKDIDISVKELLEHFDKKGVLGQNGIDSSKVKEIVRKLNIKNGIFYVAGVIVSTIGLGILIPKVAFGLTKLISGKDGFIGIEGDDDKKVVNNC